MSPPMIEVAGVVYDYPAARALHGVGFSVEAGSVLAMVGPNGAGKTTLLRCMAALDSPTEGKIRIAGLDTQDDPRGVHEAIGYLPDFFGLYDDLTVRRALTYAARSRGMDAAATPAANARLMPTPARAGSPSARAADRPRHAPRRSAPRSACAGRQGISPDI